MKGKGTGLSEQRGGETEQERGTYTEGKEKKKTEENDRTADWRGEGHDSGGREGQTERTEWEERDRHTLEDSDRTEWEERNKQSEKLRDRTEGEDRDWQPREESDRTEEEERKGLRRKRRSDRGGGKENYLQGKSKTRSKHVKCYKVCRMLGLRQKNNTDL